MGPLGNSLDVSVFLQEVESILVHGTNGYAWKNLWHAVKPMIPSVLLGKFIIVAGDCFKISSAPTCVHLRGKVINVRVLQKQVHELISIGKTPRDAVAYGDYGNEMVILCCLDHILEVLAQAGSTCFNVENKILVG